MNPVYIYYHIFIITTIILHRYLYAHDTDGKIEVERSIVYQLPSVANNAMLPTTTKFSGIS